MIAIINVRLTVNKNGAGIMARSIHYSPFYKAAFNDLIYLVGMWGTLPWQRGIFYFRFMRFCLHLYSICFLAAWSQTCWELGPQKLRCWTRRQQKTFFQLLQTWRIFRKWNEENWSWTNIQHRIRHCSNGFGSLADKAINIGVYRVSEKGQGQRREGKKMRDEEIKRGNESSRIFN